MTEHSITVRLRIAKWYAKNLLVIEPGFNAHLGGWNREDNECTATFTCFDNYPYPPYRRTKEDLEEYVVRRFGSMIIESKRRGRNLDLSSASKGVPLKHPLVLMDKKDYPSMQDNFSEEYLLPLTKEQLIEANSVLVDDNNIYGRRIKADKIKKTSGYESDIHMVRIGKWQ